ncbi:hypothetical protein [Paraburkholderia heleia]|uniref:hypothetical protein n=1 Tax=Paraburkholderia heleia TaxID=634127 RepID=UPI002AB7B2AD|nr:hypothetical protein [Paraburkholderia heleia]
MTFAKGTALLAVVIYPLLIAGLWVWKFRSDVQLEEKRISIEKSRAEWESFDIKERFEIQKRAIDRPSASGDTNRSGAPEEQGADATAAILRDFVESQSSSAGKSPVAPLMGLVDSLVSAGTVAAKDASNLKEAIQTAAIDGGKEIVVETAKALIDRFIKPHEKDEASSREGSAGGVTMINNNYCSTIDPRTKPESTTDGHPSGLRRPRHQKLCTGER